MFGGGAAEGPGGGDERKKAQHAVALQKLKDWFVKH